MKFIVVSITLLLLSVLGCSSVHPKLQDEYIRPGLSEGMSSVFNIYRKSIPEMMADQKTTGLSIALVDSDGILWASGFGYADYSQKTPVTPETLFAIMSISKTFMATVVMTAVQDGLVELDAPIIEYWPDFSVNSRFEENPQDKITLRHLLSHTSGIAQEAPRGNSRQASYLSLEGNISSISETWLRHEVGEGYYYGDLGYELAAYIIQLQSNQPFAEYVKDKVFSPLKMPNCSANPEYIRNHSNRAVGHRRHVKQVPLVMEIPKTGSAGIYANAEEMARFVQFFLNQGTVDGQGILDNHLVSSMVSPSMGNTHYGLGVKILHDNHGTHILGHTGGGFGFTSGICWLPEYGIGCVVLYNSDRVIELIDIFHKLIEAKAIEKNESYEIKRSNDIQNNDSGQPNDLPLDPNTFTPFKPAWQKYLGTYKYLWNGWELGTLTKSVLALGVTDKYTHIKIYEKEGYLHIDSLTLFVDDGGRLDEYLPGLFFTPSGKCLDLRDPDFTWQNYSIEKVK